MMHTNLVKILFVTLLAVFVLSTAYPINPCGCPRRSQIVCGSNGQDYDSKCILECFAKWEKPGLILDVPYSCTEKEGIYE